MVGGFHVHLAAHAPNCVARSSMARREGSPAPGVEALGDHHRSRYKNGSARPRTPVVLAGRSPPRRHRHGKAADGVMLRHHLCRVRQSDRCARWASSMGPGSRPTPDSWRPPGRVARRVRPQLHAEVRQPPRRAILLAVDEEPEQSGAPRTSSPWRVDVGPLRHSRSTAVVPWPRACPSPAPWSLRGLPYQAYQLSHSSLVVGFPLGRRGGPGGAGGPARRCDGRRV